VLELIERLFGWHIHKWTVLGLWENFDTQQRFSRESCRCGLTIRCYPTHTLVEPKGVLPGLSERYWNDHSESNYPSTPTTDEAEQQKSIAIERWLCGR
jgi:hypothetical protein